MNHYYCFPQSLALQSTLPMNYYTAFHHISELLPKDCIIVSEGANTMDIGRTMLLNYLPRHRWETFSSPTFHSWTRDEALCIWMITVFIPIIKEHQLVVQIQTLNKFQKKHELFFLIEIVFILFIKTNKHTTEKKRCVLIIMTMTNFLAFCGYKEILCL